ncbi:MAG: hypothetical protein IJW55_06415 [Clostridia bacterium]|nr:hypothetical protein [Clostridia bacterium]
MWTILGGGNRFLLRRKCNGLREYLQNRVQTFPYRQKATERGTSIPIMPKQKMRKSFERVWQHEVFSFSQKFFHKKSTSKPYYASIKTMAFIRSAVFFRAEIILPKPANVCSLPIRCKNFQNPPKQTDTGEKDAHI